MSNNEDKKPAPPRAPATPMVAAYADAKAQLAVHPPTDAIPVAFVRWERALQYPGKGSATEQKNEILSNGNSWTIDYLPALRHFRIAFFEKAKGERRLAYVHEARALAWEPA